MLDSVAVRRKAGYAAAESRLRRQRIRLCTVEAGEVIGDVETVFKLDTYLETVVCISPVQVT